MQRLSFITSDCPVSKPNVCTYLAGNKPEFSQITHKDHLLGSHNQLMLMLFTRLLYSCSEFNYSLLIVVSLYFNTFYFIVSFMFSYFMLIF